jgi:hypothetical protein
MSIELSSEVEAALRAEAGAIGIGVDVLIARACKAYVAARRPDHSPRHRAAEMAWAASPDERLRGKWVVLEGDNVAEAGPDPLALYENARAKGISSPFLIFVSPREPEHFAGGWID